MEQTFKVISFESRTNKMPLVKSHFKRLEWCLRSASKDEGRKNIWQAMKIIDGTCYCTDGIRMAKYVQDLKYLPKSTIIPDGLWRLLIKNGHMMIFEKVEEVDFFVFPDIKHIFGVTFIESKPEKFIVNDEEKVDGISRFVGRIYRDSGKTFNLRLLRDAFIPNSSVICKAAQAYAPDRGMFLIEFIEKSCAIIIMPLMENE